MDPIQGSSLAALMLNICEHMYNLPDEIVFIWSTPWRFRSSSYMFIFARYAPYVIHTFNAKYAQAVKMSDPTYAYVWILYKWITATSMILIVQYTLLKRIYLLYNRQKFIKFFVALIVILRISELAGIAYSVHKVLWSSSGLGQMGTTPFSIAVYYSVGELFIQGSILGLTLIKYLTITYGDVGRTPLAYRLTRAGIEVPMITLCALGVTMLIGKYNKPALQMVYALYLTLMSSMGCRLILSTHRHFPLYNTPRAQVADVED